MGGRRDKCKEMERKLQLYYGDGMTSDSSPSRNP